MSKLGPALVSMTLLLLVLTVPSAGGSEYEDTVTLVPLESETFEIDNGAGDLLTISYDVAVITGVPVNVYFLDEEGYRAFDRGEQFDAYTKYSAESTRAASRQWNWEREGVFYIVIANLGQSSTDNATVEYEVGWEEVGFFGRTPWYMCLVFVAVVVVVVIFIFSRQM